jgi:hypothetical protein
LSPDVCVVVRVVATAAGAGGVAGVKTGAGLAGLVTTVRSTVTGGVATGGVVVRVDAEAVLRVVVATRVARADRWVGWLARSAAAASGV